MIFDIGALELVVLVILGMLLFGPDKLPKMIQDVASFIRKVRAFSDSARDDIRKEMGPEFKDFEFQDLNPKQFAQKHLLDNDNLGLKEIRDSFDLRKELSDVKDAVDLHSSGPAAADSSPGLPAAREGAAHSLSKAPAGTAAAAGEAGAAGAPKAANLSKSPDPGKPVGTGGAAASTPPPFDPDAT